MIKVLILSLLLVGCYTTNKAKKQVVKAHALKPNVTAELCTSFYPTKDSIVKETINIPGKNDTVLSMVIDTVYDKSTNTIYLDRIKYINRVDTVFKSVFSNKQSTSKTIHLNNKINDLNELKAVNKQTISNLKESRNKWRFYMVLAIVLYFCKVYFTKKLF